eukprot:SAG22_NODE_1713_length_3750_cov_1.552177_6_plen_247_part_00
MSSSKAKTRLSAVLPLPFDLNPCLSFRAVCPARPVTEDVKARYEAYGWQVLELADGTDLAALKGAVEAAKAETTKPTMIKIATRIGEGCPSKVGSHKVHGAPLGAAGIEEMKAHLGLPAEAFAVAPEVTAYYAEAGKAASAAADAHAATMAEYTAKFPEEAAALKRQLAGELPADWKSALSPYGLDAPKKATRQWSEMCLNEIGPVSRVRHCLPSWFHWKCASDSAFACRLSATRCCPSWSAAAPT